MNRASNPSDDACVMLSCVWTLAAVVCCPIGYDDGGDAGGDTETTKRRRPLSNFQAYKLVKLEPDGRVALFTFTLFLQSKHHPMAAGMVRATNRVTTREWKE
jgi:hypothetical protein